MLSINSRLRENARVQLEGNWGKPMLVGLLYILFVIMISIIPIIGRKHFFISYAIEYVILIFLAGPLVFGLVTFSLKFKRGQKPGVGLFLEGFRYFRQSLGLYLWNLLWVLLWTLLFIVPGIIKGLSYSMSFYILADNPKIGIKNALKISKKITKGYKCKILVLSFGFVGWELLASLSIGLGYIWLLPYMQITFVNFYDELKNESVEKGIWTTEEMDIS